MNIWKNNRDSKERADSEATSAIRNRRAETKNGGKNRTHH
jgi:hypothetical protein